MYRARLFVERVLHSFPTRRSSDLVPCSCPQVKASPLLPRSRDPGDISSLPVEVMSPGSLLLGNSRSEETRLNSSHMSISYAVFCLKKKKKHNAHACA